MILKQENLQILSNLIVAEAALLLLQSSQKPFIQMKLSLLCMYISLAQKETKAQLDQQEFQEQTERMVTRVLQDLKDLLDIQAKQDPRDQKGYKAHLEYLELKDQEETLEIKVRLELQETKDQLE